MRCVSKARGVPLFRISIQAFSGAQPRYDLGVRFFIAQSMPPKRRGNRKSRNMRYLLAAGVLLMSVTTFAVDYQKSLEIVKKYQENFSDLNAAAYMLELAKSDAHPEIITHSMAIYTLHAASVGDSKTCLSAYQSALNRYPTSKTIQYLKALRLFAEPCSTCDGSGHIEKQQQKTCQACNATGRCRRCGGTGQMESSGLRGPTNRGRSSFDLRCLTCGGSGRCGSCGGNPVKSFMAQVPCPACKGALPELNASVAKDGMIRLAQSFRDLLQMACDCEAAYNHAMKSTDPVKQLEELKRCASKYSQAINYSIVREKISEVTKKAETALLERERLQREAEEQKAKDEIQKALLTQKHEELLYHIQNTKTTRVALKGIQGFILDNPKSPIIEKARLMRAELEARLETEQAAATRNHYILMGGGVFVVISLLSWLASCIRFK